LGMSRAFYLPVYSGDEFVPRLMLPLSLCYYHRLIDGADAARFVRWVAQALEQSFLLALEGYIRNPCRGDPLWSPQTARQALL
ncbi:MAG: hypothetical protein V7641_4354, partial [Blastocatellia bacterium]